MAIETTRLPTHLALVGRRLNLSNTDDLANTFLETSYLAEVTIKTLAVVLQAALRPSAPEVAYRQAYDLVRADGLGAWENTIREATTQPVAGYLGPEFHQLLAWATRRRTRPEEEWFKTAFEAARTVLRELGSDDPGPTKPSCVRDLLTALVQIRNKTKAHGAVGQDFYATANSPYLVAVSYVVQSCPAISWRWLHLTIRESGKNRAIQLLGQDPQHLKETDASKFTVAKPGIHFIPEGSNRPFFCGDLLRGNRDCNQFFIPNGATASTSQAEFIDYGTGKTQKESITDFLSPPVPLPGSETEGATQFDVQSNIYGNLPEIPSGYVQRCTLESELTARLRDKNHPIITLHGGGGMGKTFLALFVCHQLAKQDPPPFDHIVWFSARDIDLRPGGPSAVRPSVLDLQSVSSRFADLFSVFEIPQDPTAFSQILQSPQPLFEKGILFVFDNFETLSDVREFHRFLDEHTHLPNKVLITSRERAFKADYPIEVLGMEYDEAARMMQLVAVELGIEGLVTSQVIERVYEYTNGHAYVMRVILGEMAKEKRYTPPAQLMGRRSDIVDAVFERSFNKLSDGARQVFLAVSNWKSDVPELALLVTLGIRGIDVEGGIEECRRLSLIFPKELPGGHPCYSAPQLARVFGHKKLQGDPDRLVIQADLLTLQKFGVLGKQAISEHAQEQLITKFVDNCFAEIGGSREAIERADKLLEALAALWLPGWLRLADFRERAGLGPESVSAALRRAVEEQPFLKPAWLRRADFAERTHDEPTRIASLVSAVDADPTDRDLIREVAYQLCRYVNDHLTEIPKARRGVYLASVRSHMERVAHQLDATGLSRLAWLFLLEDNTTKAREYAEKGCEQDPTNVHCLRILQRLDNQAGSSQIP